MKNLSREELLELLNEYDKYIIDVVDDLPLQYVDRVPVCVGEFYDNEFQLSEQDKEW